MAVLRKEVLEDLRSRSEIADVVGGYVRLQRAGSGFKALCPFHKEKTPSFHVQPQRQAFHCFGCHAGGDVFRFIMDIEGVDFPTAVKLLAKRAGMVLEWDGAASPSDGEDKEALYRLLEQLVGFYQRVLRHSAGGAAREYLASRGLDGEPARRFRFGFAPTQAETLPRWAAKNGFRREQLLTAGMLAAGDRPGGNDFDRFRGRLMIPICDELGRPVGFTGRVLRAEDHPAKYVNSPETPLFHKSRVLFALDQARKAIVDTRRAVLCEGQLDTIRCHVAGIANVVAAQGTSVTEDHARILNRYADEVVLVLDPDEAGRKAAVRSAQLLVAAGLSVRIAALPEGEDPDSLIRAGGPEAFLRAVEDAVSAVRFQARLAREAGEMASEAGRGRAGRAVLELVAAAASQVQQTYLLREAAEAFGIPEHRLRRDLERMLRRRPSARARDEAPAEADGAEPPAAETGLLELAFAHPEELDAVRPYLADELFIHPAALRLWRDLEAHRGDRAWQPAAERPEDEAYTRLAGRLVVGARPVEGADFSALQALRDVVLRLWAKAFERRRTALRREAPGGKGPGAAAAAEASRELTIKLEALRGSWEQALPVLDMETG